MHPTSLPYPFPKENYGTREKKRTKRTRWKKGTENIKGKKVLEKVSVPEHQQVKDCAPFNRATLRARYE
jgi:hypothetical protein